MGFLGRFMKKSDQKSSAATNVPPSLPSKRPESNQVADAVPRVKEITVEELKARIDRGDVPLIVDVREPWEYQIVHLAQALHIPMRDIPSRIHEFDMGADIVVHCHVGGRSYDVTAYLTQNGFTNVKNLAGGIDAWARRIDPTLSTY